MILNGSIYSQSVRLSDLSPRLFTNDCSVFELVSAYGTVGLSLGIPDVGHVQFIMPFINPWSKLQQNYSLSGEFSTLTKLIFCLVMIRGRHRGLPAAIDRAVMFPAELQETDDLIRETRNQVPVDEGLEATSYRASTPPSRPLRYSGTIDGNNKASSVHQRSRPTWRRFSASKEEYDVAETGQAGWSPLYHY